MATPATHVVNEFVNETRRNSLEPAERAVTAWTADSSRPGGLRRAKRCGMVTGLGS